MARLDAATGALVQGLDVGSFTEGEGLDVAAGEGQVFVSGEHGELVNQTGFLAALAPDHAGDLQLAWSRDVEGTRSNGVTVELTGVVVSQGSFSVRRHGLARYDFMGDLQWEWLRTTGPDNASQVVGLGGRGDALYVAAMLDGDAVVAPAVDDAIGMFAPLVSESGSGSGDDATQVVRVLPDGSIAAGYLVGQTTGRDAWIARFALDGAQRWSRVFDGGSNDRDEIEDVGVLDDGDVVAVGMLGVVRLAPG